MGGILLDNWTVGSYFLQLLDHKNGYQAYSPILCKNNLLTGILLWDKIDIILHHTLPQSQIDKIRENGSIKRLLSVCNIIENPGLEFEKYTSETFKAPQWVKFESGSEGFYFEDEQSFLDFDEIYAPLLRKRAEIYLDISTKLGLNYFPHPQRADYLQRKNIFNMGFNRDMLIQHIDKSLLDYYNQVNEKYGHNLINCPYPVLYDYIRAKAKKDGTGSLKDELEVALELRENKDIIDFRKSLNNIDDGFNNGNLLFVDTAFKQIEELSKAITNSHPKDAIMSQLTIGLSPSLSIPVRFPNIRKKIISLTFLTKLLDFGIKERLTKENRLIYKRNAD